MTSKPGKNGLKCVYKKWEIYYLFSIDYDAYRYYIRAPREMVSTMLARDPLNTLSEAKNYINQHMAARCAKDETKHLFVIGHLL